MAGRQQDVLRLQPHTIPSVRTALASALDQLDNALLRLRQRAHLPEPWLGDEASHEVAAHYTERAMAGPESSYQALVAYRDELTRVHDTLHQMEAAYRRTEGDNTALWGRMA